MAASIVLPVYVMRLDWKLFPNNVTKLGLVLNDDMSIISLVSGPISNVTLQLASFLVLTIFTIFFVKELKTKAQWRHLAATKASTVSQRDTRVAVMVAFVSFAFICCHSLLASQYIWIILDHEFHPAGKSRNLFMVIGALTRVAQTLNSTMNIYMYLKMSTRYRETFMAMFAI